MVAVAVSGETFFDFARGTLIPNMLSIVILDNCSVHHVAPVLLLFLQAGILVLWLPPYSPDYNPIENAFSKVKYYLKEHDDILQVISDPSAVIKASFDNITGQDCLGWIRHCGY
jgi:transposase